MTFHVLATMLAFAPEGMIVASAFHLAWRWSGQVQTWMRGY